MRDKLEEESSCRGGSRDRKAGILMGRLVQAETLRIGNSFIPRQFLTFCGVRYRFAVALHVYLLFINFALQIHIYTHSHSPIGARFWLFLN